MQTVCYDNIDPIIIEQNAKGVPDRHIAKQLGIGKTTIQKRRASLGLRPVPWRSGRFSPITEEIVASLYARHMLGATITELAKENGYGVVPLWNAFKRYGYKTKSIQETNSYPINSHCFDEINDDSAYWLGFLMADGSNCKRNRGFYLTVAEKDSAQLDKIKEFTGYQGPVYHREVKSGYTVGVKYCTIRIGNPIVSAAISKWGIVPKKTFVAKAHSDLVLNRHFWRGVIDGDGHISRADKCVTVNLCGSLYLVNQFSDFVEHLTGEKVEVKPHKSIFILTLNGNKARRILRELYIGCKYFLDRKMALAQHHLNNIPGGCHKTPEEIASILSLRADGLTSRQIGKKLNISKATVMRYIKLSQKK